MSGVAILVPMLDEADALPGLMRTLARLDPAADEVLFVDGGSRDGSVELVEAAGGRVLRSGARHRGGQVNEGVLALRAPVVCVLHADTVLPWDAVAVMERVMGDRRTVLAGFTAVLAGAGGVRWGTSAHNWVKTWYAPLLFRPLRFLRGLRLLFGDHAMFFRREAFLSVGGCDDALPVMEDADLCVRLHRAGRVRLVRRVVMTSDRRVAAWGAMRANWVYLSVSLRWAFGERRGLAGRYPPVR